VNQRFFLCLIALTFVGCASTKTEDLFNSKGDESQSVTAFPASNSNGDSLMLSSESSSSKSGEIIYRGMKVENTNFDIPVEMNKAVEKWVDYFTGRGRERFAHYLERSEIFIPFLLPILKNAKAPEDLVYLAMIESGFNNNARSHARAVGAWQFISATGRRYGLDINWWVDERRDVEKSTIAAIQYLKELNAMFGSWHLATAAYNAGESKIQRAIKKYKTADFWALCDKRFTYLRPETKNYVPKLFAAAIVGKNRKQFGFEESYSKIKSVNAAMVSAKAEEGDSMERLPDLLEGDKPSDGETQPTIELTKDSPADAEEEAILAEDSVETMLRDMSNKIRTPHVNRKGEVNGDILTEIEVPSPADLFKVSSAAGLSYLEFKSMNPELLRWVTPPTSNSYKIRIPLSHKDAFVKKYFDPTFERDVDFLSYKARKGDSPSRVAKRFGISPEPVAQMNDVSSQGSSFMPGKIVQLPIPSDFVRSLASLKSLDLIDPPTPKRPRVRRGKTRRKQARNVQSIRSGRAQSYESPSRKRL
jgi:hypothetical protein